MGAIYEYGSHPSLPAPAVLSSIAVNVVRLTGQTKFILRLASGVPMDPS
jgi:hypothetical protein